MQTSSIIRHLRLIGVIIGFLLFTFTAARWVQHAASVEALQDSQRVAQITP